MKKIFKLTVACLFTVSCYTFQGHANQKRNVSNVTQVNPIIDCRHIGLLDNDNRILIERTSFTEEALVAEHDFGVKGIFIDLYGTGGFRIYKDQSDYKVEVEAEGMGVIDNLSFSRLPIRANLPIQIELAGKNLVETRLICLEWSEESLRE